MFHNTIFKEPNNKECRVCNPLCSMAHLSRVRGLRLPETTDCSESRHGTEVSEYARQCSAFLHSCAIMFANFGESPASRGALCMVSPIPANWKLKRQPAANAPWNIRHMINVQSGTSYAAVSSA
jgi:hypothetical protein